MMLFKKKPLFKFRYIKLSGRHHEVVVYAREDVNSSWAKVGGLKLTNRELENLKKIKDVGIETE